MDLADIDGLFVVFVMIFLTICAVLMGRYDNAKTIANEPAVNPDFYDEMSKYGKEREIIHDERTEVPVNFTFDATNQRHNVLDLSILPPSEFDELEWRKNYPPGHVIRSDYILNFKTTDDVPIWNQTLSGPHPAGFINNVKMIVHGSTFGLTSLITQYHLYSMGNGDTTLTGTLIRHKQLYKKSIKDALVYFTRYHDIHKSKYMSW